MTSRGSVSIGRSIFQVREEMRRWNPDAACFLSHRADGHDWVTARSWFRHYRVCESCGLGERT